MKIMVFSCFAVYVLANNTQVVPYFYRQGRPYTTQNMVQPVLFARRQYNTAKQLKSMYYSLIVVHFAKQTWCVSITVVFSRSD